MRFTDGKEKLEIEIHEGQHSWDTTVGFFDHLTNPILNGTRQAGNVRTLLTNVYNRILGMSGYPAPEADTRAIYTITDLAGNIVREGSFASSDNPANSIAAVAVAFSARRTRTFAAIPAGVITAIEKLDWKTAVSMPPYCSIGLCFALISYILELFTQ